MLMRMGEMVMDQSSALVSRSYSAMIVSQMRLNLPFGCMMKPFSLMSLIIF